MNSICIISFLLFTYQSDSIAQFKCNDSIYCKLKSKRYFFLSKEEKEYFSFFEANCKLSDSSKWNDSLSAIEAKTGNEEIHPDLFLLRGNYLFNKNLKGYSGSLFIYQKDSSNLASLGQEYCFNVEIIEKKLDSISLLDSSIDKEVVLINFGGALGLLLNPNKLLSFFIDLQLESCFIGGFSLGFGSNQETFINIGNENKLIIGIGFHEMIRTKKDAHFTFGMLLSLGLLFSE